MARKPKVKTTVIKKGRRIYGHIYHCANHDIYLAARNLDQIFRFGEKTISDAVRQDKAAWAIDEETLDSMRRKGIKYVGVQVREYGDIYITKLENFLNRKLSKFLDYASRGGARQRYLPMQYFHHIPGRMKIKR